MHSLSKQVKQLDEANTYQNKQLVKHIQEKHDCQKRLEQVESALQDMSDKYECIKREHQALQGTNVFLEKRVRELSSENQMFLGQLMDLKEKQIERFNEANQLYEEVESMKMKLEVANLPEGTLKIINEIMKAGGVQGANIDGKGDENQGAKLRSDQLRKELLQQVKEHTLNSIKE